MGTHCFEQKKIGIIMFSPVNLSFTMRALVIRNKNIKMSSFKSSENIQKNEGGPDRSVSDNQSSSVTLK